jgi:predicted GNAT family acetyltransferase
MSVHSTEPVRHTETGNRGVFFIERDGHRVAELTYTLSGDTAMVDHTYVVPRLRGGMLAARLVAAAVDWARRERRVILPLCSYVRAVFDHKPEYADVRK